MKGMLSAQNVVPGLAYGSGILYLCAKKTEMLFPILERRLYRTGIGGCKLSPFIGRCAKVLTLENLYGDRS